MFRHSNTIAVADNEVWKFIQAEADRQEQHIELIASENFVSPAVMAAVGSHLTNKYAEGLPGKRYYGGCQYVDIVENLTIERCKQLFGCDHVNVQPHSGAQANTAVYFALLNPGDTILGMNLSHGGHLTHGSPVNISGKYFKIVPYGVSKEDERIDYDALEQLHCDSDISGRVTMQKHFALPELFEAKDFTPIGKPSFYKACDAEGYTIAVDSKGRLRWPANCSEGRPLLVITGENAPKEYAEALRQQGISWIAAGKDETDLTQAVEILSKEFGVERLAVVGGGIINGAFLKAGLLDEVSVVVGAGIDGRKGMTAVFDGIDDPSFPTTILKLNSVERIGDNSVWLRYSF